VPPLPCGKKGDISHPFFIGCRSFKITCLPDWERSENCVYYLLFVLYASFARRTDTFFLHQSYYSFSSAMNTLCFQFCMNARTAIHTPIGMIRIAEYALSESRHPALSDFSLFCANYSIHSLKLQERDTCEQWERDDDALG
jgi:hypothetical protein